MTTRLDAMIASINYVLDNYTAAKENSVPVASYPVRQNRDRQVTTQHNRAVRTNPRLLGGKTVVDLDLFTSSGVVLTPAEARRLALNLLVATGDAQPGLTARVTTDGAEAHVQRPGGSIAVYKTDARDNTAARAASALMALVAVDDYAGSEAARLAEEARQRAAQEREDGIEALVKSVGDDYVLSHTTARRMYDAGVRAPKTGADSPF